MTNKCPECKKERMEGEKCGCEVVPIVKVDYPNDGIGTFTYLKGYKYPYAGFADQHIVDLDGVTKRVLISSLFLAVKKPFVYAVPLLFFFRNHALKAYVKWYARILDAAFKPIINPQVKYPPRNRMSHAVREFLRATDQFTEGNEDAKTFFMGIAMALEFDNAYRFRYQDFIGELNKENLKNNYRKEILRLFSLVVSREKQKGEVGEYWVYNKLQTSLVLLKMVLFLWPQMGNGIKAFLMEVDVEQSKADAADWYYMSERWDYDFGGMSFEERLKAKNEEDREWKKEHPEVPTKFEELKNKPYIGLAPSESFWDLDKMGAEKMIQDLTTNFMKEFESRKVKV